MARKKQEQTEELTPVAETEISAKKAEKPKKSVKKPTKKEETAPVEEKKTVRRGRKPAAKKEEITSTGTPMTLEKTEEKQEQVQETEIKKEETAPLETKAEKPKRAKKSVKKAEIPEEKKEKPSEKKTATRAEKNEVIRNLIKELLSARPYKWAELLDECSKRYEEKIEDKEGRNANDVRGRIGSVFDVMKKEKEVSFDGGTYALSAIQEQKATEEKPTETKEEKAQEAAEKPVENTEKLQEKTEKQLPAVKPEAKLAPVFDMTAIFSEKPKKEEKQGGRVESKAVPEKKSDEKPIEKAPEKKEEKSEEKPKRQEKTVAQSAQKAEKPKKTEKKPQKQTEEKLKEAFLRKIRSLGGKYFEYYSIYLLERYSLRNGRRVDGLKVSGGDHDGGIDGEIEVTDRIGFKETIYVQAKNWNPNCGKQESWVIGETNLQQFIGAVAYRQAREGKQHCRGIFVTTSYFTSGAKEMLAQMSDKFVGYDGDDLFEAAKECSFGVIERDGQWLIDEKLLAGEKAFFNLY